jgi:ABC-type dipeptide/oligopeptide/nickel transport system permease component
MPQTLTSSPAVPADRFAAHALQMLQALIQRLASRILMMLFVALIVFIVLRVLPVDPLGMLLSPNATKADAIALRHTLGLDLPLYRQFLIWLQHALAGDFGISIQSGRAVGPLILDALPTTLQLVACGLLLGVLTGIVSGLLAFRYRGTRIESGIEIGNSIAISIPDFLWAILMILGLGIGLRLLPFLGPIDASISVPSVTGFLLLDSLLDANGNAFLSTLAHLVMPSMAMALGIAPPLMRILRSSLIEVYNEDYIVAARLRGISENGILLHHALRNAALPTVSMIGMQAGTVIGGTLLLESIYGFPGIGNLMVSAIANHDLPVIQGLALTYALSVLIMNMCTDTLLLIINPRLRAA